MRRMQVDLLGYVRTQLDAYDGSLSELARECGVKVSWLHMFRRGQIPNPGVQQVQLLADHFRSSRRSRRGNPPQQAA